MVKPISDEELQLKVRARRRILGAVALAVACVVLLPMVLDSPPPERDPTEQVALTIPAQDKVAPFDPPLKQAEKTAPAAIDGKPLQQPAKGVAKLVPMEVTPLENSPEKSTDKPTRVEAGPPAESDKVPDNNEVPETRKATDTAKPAAAEVGRFAVQLGVFAHPKNARQVEMRLKENKIRHYTQTLKSPSGAVRVRAGPYANRAEAENALSRMKLAGISGGVVVSE